MENSTENLANKTTNNSAKNLTSYPANETTDNSAHNSTDYPANTFEDQSSLNLPMNSTNSSSFNNNSSPGDWLYNNTSSGTSTTLSPSPSPVPSNFTSSSLVLDAPSTNVTFSSATSDTIPVNSGDFDSHKPDVMGHLQLDASMWKNPGVIIGVACSVVGLICVLFGVAYSLHLRRKARPSIHNLRVVSGYDFNGGSEDDDHLSYMTWNKANFKFANAEKNSSTFDDSQPHKSTHRHSTATAYSNADVEEFERIRSFEHYTHERGIAI